MSNPFNVLRAWKTGDTGELSERALKQAQIDGKFDSYSQVYDLDGRRRKVQEQVSQPTGETVYTLGCVDE